MSRVNSFRFSLKIQTTLGQRHFQLSLSFKIILCKKVRYHLILWFLIHVRTLLRYKSMAWLYLNKAIFFILVHKEIHSFLLMMLTLSQVFLIILSVEISRIKQLLMGHRLPTLLYLQFHMTPRLDPSQFSPMT